MNKIIKKIILITTIVVLMAVTVSATFSIDQILNKDVVINMEKYTQQDVAFMQDPMFQFLTQKYEDKEKREEALRAYAVSKATEKLTKDDCSSIYGFVIKGYDFFDVMNSYLYCLGTKEGVSITEEILKKSINFDEDYDYWISDTYDQITNYVHGTLTKEKIDEYMKNGIKEKEIMFADELSKKSNISIEKILENFKTDKRWINIISDIYPRIKEGQSVINKLSGLFSDTLKHDSETVGHAIELSEKTDINIIKLLFYCNSEKINLYYEQYINNSSSNAMKLLHKYGYISEKESSGNLKQNLYDDIKNMGISEMKIEELQKDYDLMKIYNAANKAKIENSNIDEVLGGKNQ